MTGHPHRFNGTAEGFSLPKCVTCGYPTATPDHPSLRTDEEYDRVKIATHLAFDQIREYFGATGRRG